MTDIILVGHSYGGMVITGVADRALQRVGHLVYLDATRPRNGASMVDSTPVVMAEVYKEMQVVDGVELVAFPDSPTMALMGVDDPADLAWMLSKITPHPWKCFSQPLVLQNEEAVWGIPRTSINCTPVLQYRHEEDLRRTLDADYVFEIDTGHDLMITEPEAVADMLLKTAELSRN